MNNILDTAAPAFYLKQRDHVFFLFSLSWFYN